MSLKSFHVVFIAAAALLALFCAARAFVVFNVEGTPLAATLLLASLIAAGALVGYERRFIRFCRREGLR